MQEDEADLPCIHGLCLLCFQASIEHRKASDHLLKQNRDPRNGCVPMLGGYSYGKYREHHNLL